MLSELFSLLGPETVLAAVAILIYLGGAFVERPAIWRWAALAGLAFSAIMLLESPREAAATMPVAVDGLSAFARWLALGVGLLLVLIAWRPLERDGTPEYHASLLLIVAGLMLVAVARDLVLLFVGLELVSIPTYVLLYLGRHSAASQEATAKYFFLSVLASAILLYGLSFLYGAAGSTSLPVIAERVGEASTLGGFGLFARLALVMVIAGLGFRIAAVPFHFYAPDVFQGTSHGNAALLSVVPKIAGFVALARIAAAMLPGIQAYAWPAVAVLSALTMTLANLLALQQTNFRRLLAYSSIANAGYMLIGLAVFFAADRPETSYWHGLGAMLFYLAVYAVATIGAFAAAVSLERGDRQLENIDELSGLAWSGGIARPMLAGALALFMFSLAGLPPLAGFWGKLTIFGSSLSLTALTTNARPWFVVLAILGVLNSAVAAAYYLRILGIVFFRPAPATTAGEHRVTAPYLVSIACGLLVLAIGVYPSVWLEPAQRAGRELQGTIGTARAAHEASSERPSRTQRSVSEQKLTRTQRAVSKDCEANHGTVEAPLL